MHRTEAIYYCSNLQATIGVDKIWIGSDRTTDRVADRITDLITDRITERKTKF